MTTANDSIARVTITRSVHAPSGLPLFNARVVRNGACEWAVESHCEKTLRRTLNRFGYPSTKKLVPLSA